MLPNEQSHFRLSNRKRYMSVVVTQESMVVPFDDIIRGPYTISSRGAISDEQATRLVQVLQAGGDVSPNGVLGGRGRTLSVEIEGLGSVFVKRYSHGGLFRAFSGGLFLCVGPCRSQEEFEMLEFVRSIGVSAPRPIAFIKKGSTVFSTWLVMEELSQVQSLVELQKSEGEELHRAMDQLALQVGILIKHKVLHVDLHPGNVLVSSAGQVCVVDFDKACHFRGSERALRELYLRRWRRAVIKHHLSPLLSEMMCLTLRSSNE